MGIGAKESGKKESLTDLHLTFNSSFASISVVNLSLVVIVHHFDKFTRYRGVLQMNTTSPVSLKVKGWPREIENKISCRFTWKFKDAITKISVTPQIRDLKKNPRKHMDFLGFFFIFFFHFNPLTIGNCYRRNWSQHGGCHSTRPLASTMLTHCCSAKVYCYLQKLIYFASKMNYEENMFLNEYMWTVFFLYNSLSCTWN